MKTGEAVEFIKDRKYALDWWSSYPEKFNQIIDLLQQGEAFKKMWGELKGKYGTFFKDTEEGRCLGEMMGIFEYKYLPKPKEKLIELMAELDKAVKEVLEGLGAKHGKNSINRSKGRRLDEKEKEKKVKQEDIKKAT